MPALTQFEPAVRPIFEAQNPIEMKFGVVIFPGSNCDHDMLHVLGTVMGADVREIWHKDTDIGQDFTSNDCIVLPGGFSFGDYLRTGAIARFSPIMDSVIEFANSGGKVFGVCNGFQILCEAGLLPGVLLQNDHQKFLCDNIYLKADGPHSVLSETIPAGKVLKIPIAHADGRYFANADTLAKIEANNQVLFRYTDSEGNKTEDANPNGSLNNIAGVRNEAGNVFGMMPHPERAAEDVLGNVDGRLLFESLMSSSVVSV
ncbi:MAG: phosphoribosylformylglycinamidine synthase I [Limisphaerales bacterium]|jgi:phosphoribosylformylglycinamidine synthase I